MNAAQAGASFATAARNFTESCAGGSKNLASLAINLVSMSKDPFRFEIGPYWLTAPGSASLKAEVRGPIRGAYQVSSTNWTLTLDRFQIFLHLDPLHELTHLKQFNLLTTKRNIEPKNISVNGVLGVTHGDYGPARTWIDWWFKKGDVMLCACLQSVAFPRCDPSDEERRQHTEIIGSLRYCRDFPNEMPPHPNGSSP